MHQGIHAYPPSTLSLFILSPQSSGQDLNLTRVFSSVFDE